MLRFLFQITQPVTQDMFYAEVHTLAMVHTASRGAVIKNQGMGVRQSWIQIFYFQAAWKS